ncbi:hypothetical protein [Halorussus amylolyticus]|uniref:hypothetical protein n=1 Tax=Halorussus amylolyticus TaxID=1126242 RepID=UPI0010537C39|nr:hypothetical protein [Halorussus amylolyticus]
MVRSFEFESVGAGDERLRATTPGGESVTIPAGWFDESDEWRRIFGHVLDAGLPDAVSFDGAANVPTENALVGIRDGEAVSGGEAEALLARLDAEGAVSVSDTTVSVLFDPETADSFSRERWAAARDSLADELERVEIDLFDRPSLGEDVEAKQAELAAEIRDLLPDGDPSDIDALSDDERERFERLRERYHYYDQLDAANIDPLLAPGPSDWADQLRDATTTPSDALADFEAAVEALAALQDGGEELHESGERLRRLREAVDRLAEA